MDSAAEASVYDRVLVHYHRGLRTGGPEALHQLVDALRNQGQAAYLVPLRGTEGESRVAAYDHYDAPESLAAGGAHDAVVCPETAMRVLLENSAGTRFCWWLSIDNSELFRARRTWANRRVLDGVPSQTSLVRQAVSASWLSLRARRVLRRDIVHLSQSEYAHGFLRSHLGVSAQMLTDYTVSSGVSVARRAGGVPVVAYNATKGGHLVEHVRALVDQPVEWRPLINMTPEQVRQTLGNSDVYLDLGHQPGKDRLPREAATLGAITVVLRLGAGSSKHDVPVPENHKINPSGNLPANAATVLSEVLGDLDTARTQQSAYRSVIAAEQETFFREAHEVFLRSKPTDL